MPCRYTGPMDMHKYGHDSSAIPSDIRNSSLAGGRREKIGWTLLVVEWSYSTPSLVSLQWRIPTVWFTTRTYMHDIAVFAFCVLFETSCRDKCCTAYITRNYTFVRTGQHTTIQAGFVIEALFAFACGTREICSERAYLCDQYMLISHNISCHRLYKCNWIRSHDRQTYALIVHVWWNMPCLILHIQVVVQYVLHGHIHWGHTSLWISQDNAHNITTLSVCIISCLCILYVVAAVAPNHTAPFCALPLLTGSSVCTPLSLGVTTPVSSSFATKLETFEMAVCGVLVRGVLVRGVLVRGVLVRGYCLWQINIWNAVTNRYTSMDMSISPSNHITVPSIPSTSMVLTINVDTW